MTQFLTQLNFAVVGLVLEVIGLVILLGPNQSKKLEKMIEKGTDGLDDWHSAIHESHKQQRSNQIKSGFLIVAGITAQTFPAYLPSYFSTDSRAANTTAYTEDALSLCANSSSCEMTVQDYDRLLKLNRAKEARTKADEKNVESLQTPLSRFRTKYPQYSDLSDEELARNMHQKFYSDIDWEVFWSSLNTTNNGFDLEGWALPQWMEANLSQTKTQ